MNILPKIFSQVQSELLENSRKPKRYETVPDAELKEEFGSNFNLSVFLALSLVSPHLNGDVTDPNSLRCPGKPETGKQHQILQGPVDEDGIPPFLSPSTGQLSRLALLLKT
ncbi:hypothetical protein EK904_010947 [Melospiza melodia maxima]|nr:hypothetical protein EK904_010947 [Melospiza melodia maxima]